MRAFCPICGLRCCVEINRDCVECPEHGVISGINIRQTRGMPRWEALIEIRASQVLAQAHDDLVKLYYYFMRQLGVR